jgi:hypothetical protein
MASGRHPLCVIGGFVSWRSKQQEHTPTDRHGHLNTQQHRRQHSIDVDRKGSDSSLISAAISSRRSWESWHKTMVVDLVEKVGVLPEYSARTDELDPASRNQKDTEDIAKHPRNMVDYRPQKGPHLSLLWSEEEPLSGQTLYLGGEFCDGKIFCIPGHGKLNRGHPRAYRINQSINQRTNH